MRTNVVIDDELMAEALQLSGLPTKKAVIDTALRTFVRLKSQENIRSLRGQLRWEGDLDELRVARRIAERSATNDGDWGETANATDADERKQSGVDR